MKFNDLTGKTFGKLTVIKRVKSNNKHTTWLCCCECGIKKKIIAPKLRSGKILSCGCARRSSHPFGPYFTEHPLYVSWSTIKQRCFNNNFKGYKYWGARGITLCDEWKNSFSKFLEDMGPRPEGMTIDRIDNNGPYAPWNCRWATLKEQAGNRRVNVRLVAEGKSMIQSDWARELNTDQRYIYSYLRRGKSMDEIIKHFRR